jgi:hypothetical protein
MEGPWRLLGRLKLGREEYCQRLLTMLILDAAYPRWNTRNTPSDRGLRFLRDLDDSSFGSSALPEDVDFVDELDLPRRDDAERGGAPDWAVFCEGRLWIIELKTEAGSHRPDQLPGYAALGAHHHPDRAIDITYLTPEMGGVRVEPPTGVRFAHLTWKDVMPFVQRVWGHGTELQRQLVDALDEAFAGSGRWSEWRDGWLGDPVEAGRALAERTAEDGRQRALDHDFSSLEELQEVRLSLRDRLVDEGSSTRPWLWNEATSGGQALTEAGSTTGYELRLSRSTTVP